MNIDILIFVCYTSNIATLLELNRYTVLVEAYLTDQLCGYFLFSVTYFLTLSIACLIDRHVG